MKEAAKILVADDEPIGRQLLEAILVPEGYNIAFASDGEEALIAVSNELPDIILLDVMMPKLDGFEVCRILRQQEKTAHIPIYLITALDDRDSRLRGIDAGAFDYISKPFDRVEILAKIKNSLNQINFLRKNTTDEVFDEALISILAEINLSDEKGLSVYRSVEPDKSKHAVFNKNMQSVKYTIMLSNKLDQPNNLMANIIFGSIISKNIETKNDGLKSILNESIDYLDRIAGRQNNELLKNADFSVLVVRQSDKEFLVTGSSQSIFLVSGKPQFDHLRLQPDMELKFTELENLTAFSSNVQDHIEAGKLQIALNDMFKETGSINLHQFTSRYLSAIQDVLMVNLMFH